MPISPRLHRRERRRPHGVGLFGNAIRGMILIAPLAATGCSLWSPNRDKLPEYLAARNEIGSYQDAEGNWIRPEGQRADKRRESSYSKYTQWVPGLREKPVNKEKCNSLYEEGMKLFEEAKDADEGSRANLFRQAAKKFHDAGENWQSSYREHDAMMMEAECLFFAEDYPKAEQAYARVLKEYPRSKYTDMIDSRRMEIAMYWIRLNQVDPSPFYVLNFTDKKRPWNDTVGHGRRTLENIPLTNPTGKVADDATMELATEAFQRGDFVTAADRFDDLRRAYPDSPHQFKAHFLGLKSVLETYQGPEYNEGPLLEADKLLKTMTRQFPKQAAEEREFLNRAYAEVRYKKAERVWNIAQYRLNLQQNDAAKVHLDRILVEYDDTPFAEKAKTELERIRELPGSPPQRFEWLANAFPDRDPVKPFIQSPASK